MRSDRLRIREVEFGMKTGPVHDVEGAGKFVLVNVGGSVEPEENLDVKTLIIKGDQLGLSKSRLTLKRLLVVAKKLLNQLLEINVLRRGRFIESDPGKFRKYFEREILLTPSFENGAPKLIKIGVHEEVSFGHAKGRDKG